MGDELHPPHSHAGFTQDAPRAERKRRAQQFRIGARVNLCNCSHSTRAEARQVPVVKFGQSRSDQTGSQEQENPVNSLKKGLTVLLVGRDVMI